MRELVGETYIKAQEILEKENKTAKVVFSLDKKQAAFDCSLVLRARELSPNEVELIVGNFLLVPENVESNEKLKED